MDSLSPHQQILKFLFEISQLILFYFLNFAYFLLGAVLTLQSELRRKNTKTFPRLLGRKQINITSATSCPITHPTRKCIRIFSPYFLVLFTEWPLTFLQPISPHVHRLPAGYLFCEVRLPERSLLPKYFLSDVITTANTSVGGKRIPKGNKYRERCHVKTQLTLRSDGGIINFRSCKMEKCVRL